MSLFYTNVARYGNNILWRGYRDGQKFYERVKFKPTLFLKSKQQNTKWKALDGESVEPMQFSTMREARDFIKMYESTPEFEIYGNTKYVDQFIQNKFPRQIYYDRNLINICNIDIEVNSNDGFPNPESATSEIITITLKSHNHYYVWGMKPYTPKKSNISYFQYKNESTMLASFIEWWSNPENTPDIITGWNTRTFDIPYIINRIHRLFDEKTVQRLSPWKSISERRIKSMGRDIQTFDILGISELDYLDLFKKFTYEPQESYKLDHIAHSVLGKKKLSYDEYTNLSNLYEENFELFLDYNIKDVELVDQLDDHLGLIDLALTMAYKAGVNYSVTLGTTALWDSIIYRYLSLKNIAIPFSSNHNKDTFPGAYVKQPIPGMYNWIASFDLNSLYPSLIMQYNMSPETIISESTPNVTPDKILNDEKIERVFDDVVMAANGVHFRNDVKGHIPTIVEEFYKERVKIKKEMLECKKNIENMKEDSQEYKAMKSKISILNNNQMAIKISLNSLYGAMSSVFFRYYNLKMAEAITLTGQLTIRWSEKTANEYLNNTFKTDKDWICYIDTDSIYLHLNSIIDHFKPKNPVKFLEKLCLEAIEPALEKGYEKLHKRMNSYENHSVIKIEGIADRAIWTAKKRYIMNLLYNEGVYYKEPKLKIMGIEAIKSSTPEACRNALKSIFKTIMTKTEIETRNEIKKFFSVFKDLEPHEIAFPRSANNLYKFTDRKMIYTKGTPMHVRATLLYNYYIKSLNLEKKYEIIKDGEKIKFLYLKLPNPIKENIIALYTILPPEFKLNDYIDYETQFHKAFVSVLEPIFQSIGWSLEEKNTLEEFFG